MTYFILSSIGGTDDVPLFLADMFVLADQLGSGNGLRCFFGGLRGHICRWFPRDWTAGRKSEVFCRSQECNMVPWWCECPCRKLRGVPQIFKKTANRFSDWRLPEGNRKLSSWRPQKDSEISLEMPNILSLDIRFKNHGIKMPIKCQSQVSAEFNKFCLVAPPLRSLLLCVLHLFGRDLSFHGFCTFCVPFCHWAHRVPHRVRSVSTEIPRKGFHHEVGA